MFHNNIYMENKIKVHEFDPQIYPRKLWIVLTTENKIEGLTVFQKWTKVALL